MAVKFGIQIILVVFVLTGLHAQQMPMYNQYIFNAYTINPAEAGTRTYGTVSLLQRWQWLGVPGAPSTTSFGMESHLGSAWGMGINFTDDKMSVNRIQTMNLTAGYHIKVTDQLRVATGMCLVGVNFRNDLDRLQNMYDPDDPDIQSVSSFSPNVGIGILAYNRKFFLGLSMPRMVEYRAGRTQNAIEQVRHFFAYAGRSFDFSERIQFRPSILVKAVSGVPVQLDYNAVLSFYRIFDIGVNYRSGDSAGLLAGITLNERVTFNYVYELPLNLFAKSTLQTHEFGVRYRFGKMHYQSIQSPRFFN